jgi:2Fe-2S ferredoxin
MPKIHFIAATGAAKEISADAGLTLMEVAIDNNIEGVVAECGGACACATCHVYIADEWLAKLPAMDDMEDAMLDSAMERRAGSRLSCQIELNDELDGLTLTVADNET